MKNTIIITTLVILYLLCAAKAFAYYGDCIGKNTAYCKEQLEIICEGGKEYPMFKVLPDVIYEAMKSFFHSSEDITAEKLNILCMEYGL